DTAVVHLYQDFGHTSIFYWSKKAANINNHFYIKNEDNIVYSVLKENESLEITWKRVLRKLDSKWYQQHSILNSFDLQSSQQIWRFEREVIELFEHMKQPDSLVLLDKMWKVFETKKY